MERITYRNRWRWFGVLFAYIWILYFATNQQRIVPAHFLPLTVVDRAVPLLPWTGWIYAAVYVMPLALLFAVRTDEDVRAMVFSFAGMATFDTLIFIAHPTVYPRPALQSTFWAGLPLAVVRFCDTPRDCFPSQHVAIAFLTAFFLWRLSKFWGPAFLLLALAISVSTLTTKQHYVWDVVAGFATAAAAYRLADARRRGGVYSG